jgi:VanZ family protein
MFLRHNLPGIFWYFLIVTLSLIPGSSYPKLTLQVFGFIPIDKFIHIVFYTILFVLLIVGFKKQYQIKRLRLQSFQFAFFICFFTGLGIEIIQAAFIPLRSFEWLDISSNLFGTFIGILTFIIIYGYKALNYN